MKYLVILVFALQLFLGSCKKYPEGPKLSVVPKKERIEGKWIAESVKYNSTDSFSAYKNYIWEFTRNYSVILQVETSKKTGVWSTQTSDKEFVISYDDNSEQQFLILKMTLKEFWLRDKKSQLEFHLKPQ
ncbi:MAG: hypothetical protein IT244_03145 [Bacteroidia bacterium]|nr:hypothetical protein [Bacteroidia bacterium]